MNSTLFNGLVTDRTQAHVNRLLLLQTRGWAGMTASEKEEWYGEIAKGAYNYNDLNRVETAVAELATVYRLSVVTKTDWTVWDKPTQSDMERYLGNVRKIRDCCASAPNFPTLPNSMSNLNFVGANNIELTLRRAYEVAKASIQSGEIYSGEV